MSDPVEDNVEELWKWMKGQSPFKQMLDVHVGLEGYENFENFLDLCCLNIHCDKMEDEQQRIKDNISKNLKAADYVAEINEIWKDMSEVFRFLIKFIHDVFNLGKLQGSKLLEIGSGATVHSIASASKYFPNIVMSDYVEDNVEELRKWLKGESSIKQMLDVQAELEGYENDLATGRNLIESRIRKNVKRVMCCDVLTDGILLEKDTNPETSPPYDVVISCLTLEECPVDVKGYGDIMKRINTLLKPGGGLLLAGFFGGSNTWPTGGHRFHHLSVSQPDLLGALINAGFGDIEIKTTGTVCAEYEGFTCSNLYCLVAKKLM